MLTSSLVETRRCSDLEAKRAAVWVWPEGEQRSTGPEGREAREDRTRGDMMGMKNR
jgi:hypothetical protein